MLTKNHIVFITTERQKYSYCTLIINKQDLNDSLTIRNVCCLVSVKQK